MESAWEELAFDSQLSILEIGPISDLDLVCCLDLLMLVLDLSLVHTYL